MNTVWQDLRYAARTWRKAPGFTIIIVIQLKQPWRSGGLARWRPTADGLMDRGVPHAGTT